MPSSNPKTHLITTVDRLLGFTRAMALGVFCAGLLLFDPQIDLASIITVHQQWLARLIFLLLIGISFGLGDTFAKIL